MSEKRRRQTAAALATSAALHLLVALLVLRGLTGPRPAETPAEQPPKPIELSVIETARRSRPDRSAAGHDDLVPPSPARPGRAPGNRPIEAGGTATRPAAPTAPLPKPVDAPPSRDSRPRDSRPRDSRPRDSRPIDLSFDALGDRAKQRAAATPIPDEALEQLLGPAPEAPSRPGRRRPVSELRAEAERRADAEENVRVGRAHPLLFDFLRNARERLTPEATRIAEGLPLGAAETTKGWARGYLKGVADAHHGAFAPLRPAEDPVGGPRPDVLGGYNEAERQAASGAEERSTEVCLGVAPNHSVVATLRRSSGNAALDRLAVSSFEAAGGARPVTADVRPALACYLVRVSAYRVPPLPAVSLDLVNGRIIYPLKRITKVTVELQSVDFGPRREPSNLLHAR